MTITPTQLDWRLIIARPGVITVEILAGEDDSLLVDEDAMPFMTELFYQEDNIKWSLLNPSQGQWSLLNPTQGQWS